MCFSWSPFYHFIYLLHPPQAPGTSSTCYSHSLASGTGKNQLLAMETRAAGNQGSGEDRGGPGRVALLSDSRGSQAQGPSRRALLPAQPPTLV